MPERGRLPASLIESCSALPLTTLLVLLLCRRLFTRRQQIQSRKMDSAQQQNSSLFESAEYIPPDSIFEVTKKYLADTNLNKVNLGQGTYRDENGKP